MKKYLLLVLISLLSLAACEADFSSEPSTTEPSEYSESQMSSDSTTTGSSSNSESSSSSSSNESLVINVNPYLEGVQLTWLDVSPANAEVSYKKTTDSNYVLVDKELIRKDSQSAICDIVGVAKGTYDIKVVSGDTQTTVIENNINIEEVDRSGYAHFNYTQGVGAYNDDGTLKSNADVIYVSNATKNTVKYKSYTGIGNILAKASSFSNPICVRILDKITCAQYKYKKVTPRTGNTQAEIDSHFANELEGSDVINGIRNEAKKSTSLSSITYNGKKVYDDDSVFNMLEISNGKFITIEGIGANAELFQWGMNFKTCSSIEVKNLTFTDYPEDACAFSGDGSKLELSSNIFVHHNVFNKGKNNWDLTAEQDKGNGDGATDVNESSNVTLSYNVYNACKKTGLIGGSDGKKSKNYTYHHNYYNAPGSRLPLGREVNIHIYNNYYKSAGTCMDMRSNAYVFSEGNYFEKSSNPMKTASNAVIKSYNDVFDGCSGTNNGKKVNSRTEIVTNNNSFDKNFDTNPLTFYYDSVNQVSNVKLLTTAAQAKVDCLVLSGKLIK